jgi:hypothetical protein
MNALNTYLDRHADVAAEPIGAADGRLYMGFTRDAAQHLAELRRQVAEPQMVGAYCAAYSHRTIQATELRLGHDPDLGTTIMGMGGEGIRSSPRPQRRSSASASATAPSSAQSDRISTAGPAERSSARAPRHQRIVTVPIAAAPDEPRPFGHSGPGPRLTERLPRSRAGRGSGR